MEDSSQQIGATFCSIRVFTADGEAEPATKPLLEGKGTHG